MEERVTDDLVVVALSNALARRRPGPGFIFHSDRGLQYCSGRYQRLVKGTGGMQSMSATGSCYDNAVTESFFGTLKRELVHHGSFATLREAQSQVFRHIEGFYNRQRRHSALDYRSPEQFELQQPKVMSICQVRCLFDGIEPCNTPQPLVRWSWQVLRRISNFPPRNRREGSGKPFWLKRLMPD